MFHRALVLVALPLSACGGNVGTTASGLTIAISAVNATSVISHVGTEVD